MQIYIIFDKVQKKIYFCSEMIQRIQTIFLLIVVIAQVVLHFQRLDVELFGSSYVVIALSLVSFLLAINIYFQLQKESKTDFVE